MLTLNEQLKAQGYAMVESVFREEDLAEVSIVTEGLIKKWQAGECDDEDFRTHTFAGAPGPTLYRIHNLEKKHPCIAQLVDSKPLAEMVRKVMGGSATPTAFALILKMPYFGGNVPYHRDPIDVPPGHVYNFSVFLDESTPDNGCFEAVPGSHLLPSRGEMTAERPKDSVFVCARRGDVLIHDVCIIHGSAFSHSKKQRRSICVEFQPDYILEKSGH